MSWINRERGCYHSPSGPIFVSFTPRESINSRALLTFSAFWTRIRGALLYRPKDVSPVCSGCHFGCFKILLHSSYPWFPTVELWATSEQCAAKYRLTMSCISFTPSDRSWTSDVIGGYPFDSSFVFSLQIRVRQQTSWVARQRANWAGGGSTICKMFSLAHLETPPRGS